MNEKSIGKVFEGWETDGVLGSGTFGTVYLAHTSVENMPVYGAVKVIKIPPNDEAILNAERMGISRDLLKTYFGKFKSDLNWETTMYNTIQSPNLVRMEEMKTEDQPDAGWTGYLRTGVFTPMEVYFEKVHSGAEDAVRLGAELSSALMALEAKKLVHGDIKPENVMVADNGSFMLSDFAIKRCLQKAGANLFGSMSRDFEAPEVQTEEKSYSNLSDIYSLGVLMSYVANDCALTLSGKPEEVEGLDPKLAEIIKKAADPDPRAMTPGPAARAGDARSPRSSPGLLQSRSRASGQRVGVHQRVSPPRSPRSPRPRRGPPPNPPRLSVRGLGCDSFTRIGRPSRSDPLRASTAACA